MKEKVICGIQQVGIGVKDCVEAWHWYRKYFGFDVKVLDDEGVAEKMLPYTGGKPQPRRAIMAFNIRGGGGFEIWQPKGRGLRFLSEPAKLGDLGLLIAKIKTRDIQKTRDSFVASGLGVGGEIRTSPSGIRWFPMVDPWGNLFQIEEDSYVFVNDRSLLTGGANGIVIGVSDMDKSIEFYGKLLDYDKVAFDKTAVFEDFADMPGGGQRLRRVMLQRSKPIEGPLSPVMGTSHIELIQAGIPGKKLLEGRWWGDPGFIHLCFDVRNMDAVQKEAEALGHPFVCDSGGGFDMGDAGGHFTYVEDPDGALIEFVETFRVPIVKKLGIVIDMRGKDDRKPMFGVKAIRFLRNKK